MSNIKKFSGPIKIGNLAGDPVESDPGILYFNTSDDVLKFRSLSTWKTLLGAVQDDTSPTLGGDLNLNDYELINPIIKLNTQAVRRFDGNPLNFIEEQYLHTINLYESATDYIIPELILNANLIEGLKVDYKLKDINSNIRVGSLVVACNGTDISIFDGPSTETSTVDITFDADILPLINATAATGTLSTTEPIILTSTIPSSARNTDTFTLEVEPADANPSDTILVDFTGTPDAIVCTVTPNDGTNNGGAFATAILNTTESIQLTASVVGSARNTDTFTLEVEAPAANPTDTILVDFTGTADAIVCTVTPNDGTNNSSVPVDLTTEELVELINTGSVTGKNVTLTDGSSLRTLQTAQGGDSTDLADGGEGDGEVATFSGGVDSGLPIDLTTEELVELINTGFVVNKNITITGNALRVLQTATGGDSTDLADGGEGDGEVATFSGGVDGDPAIVITYTSNADSAVLTADVKKIRG
jgi:hypothetical protein